MPLIRKPGKSDQRAGTPAAPSAADVLRGLESLDVDKRWAAARDARSVPGCESALAAALTREVDLRVREAMFTALAGLGSPQGRQAILEFLRSDDAGLRAGALDVLRPMTDVVKAQLPKLLSDTDVDVRLLSCELARGLPGADATAMLCDLLARESEVNVIAAAIDVLAEVGDPEALSALEHCEARFQDTPFLSFAIKVAKEQIVSHSTNRHG